MRQIAVEDLKYRIILKPAPQRQSGFIDNLHLLTHILYRRVPKEVFCFLAGSTVY